MPNPLLRSMLAALATASAAVAGPPALKIPEEVRATQQYVRFDPETDAKGVIYIGLSGVEAFPSEELKDPRRFLLDTRGLAEGRYGFAAVGAGATGEQTRVNFTVVVGAEAAVDPMLPPFRKAFDADASPTKLADVRALALAYRAVAGRVRESPESFSAGDFAALVPRLRQEAIADRLESARAVFGEAIVKLNLPEAPLAVLPAERKDAIAKLFLRFAGILESIK